MKYLLSSIICLSFCVFAQAEGKIAVVKFDVAIMNSDKAKAKSKEFEARPDIKDKLEQGKKMEQEYVKLVENFKIEQEIMSVEQKLAAENKLKILKEDMQYIGRKLQEAQQEFTQNAEMQRLSVEALQAVQQIIKDEGIGLLIRYNPQIILHADTSFDITAKVTEYLNKNK